MKKKPIHFIVLVLIAIVSIGCFLLYHTYITSISSKSIEAIDFYDLRQHSEELLENGFNATDSLLGADFVYADYYSDCFIWLDSSSTSSEMPVTVAIAYSKISSCDRIINPGTANEKKLENKKWTLTAEISQEGEGHLRISVDANSKIECMNLLNQRIVELFTTRKLH